MTVEASQIQTALEQSPSVCFLLASAEFRAVTKNSKNGHFKSSYANLEECIDAVREPLLKYGLLLTFNSEADGNGMIAVSASVFRPGAGVVATSRVLLPMKDLSPQGAAALNTYGRRYALLNLFGLAAEDDDGNQAQAETKAAIKAEADAKKPAQAAETKEEKPIEVPKALASVGFSSPKKVVFK